MSISTPKRKGRAKDQDRSVILGFFGMWMDRDDIGPGSDFVGRIRKSRLESDGDQNIYAARRLRDRERDLRTSKARPSRSA
jgi:hypothetical protein